MRHLLTASALFALALVTATVNGQPQPDPKKADDATAAPKATGPKVDPTDAAIAAALANDPDVKMAKAKIQLAEAELAKARQAVTLKVVTLKVKIDQLKTEVAAAQERVAVVTRAVQAATIPQSELLAERAKLETAKAALATAEVEWKLLTGGASTALGTATDSTDARAVAAGLRWLADTQSTGDNDALLAFLAAARDTGDRHAAWLALLSRQRETVKGPVADRLRAALDKPVKLGPKGTKLTFPQALEVFKKDAGWDVPVRGEFPAAQPVLNSKGEPVLDPRGAALITRTVEVVSEGEELPLGAWFQMFEDSAVFGQRHVRYRFYVREYGLLISPADTVPPDAPTLIDFWKHKPAPEAKTEPKK